MNSEKAIKELYKAFHLLNQAYYENKLPEPYIIICETAKQGAYGWFTPYDAWMTSDGEVKRYEIALSAEYMNRDYVDVIRTLHHEMIHLHNHVNNIKDTSRQGRYHNKKFKEESEKRGFTYENHPSPDSKHGWSFNELTPETKEMIKSFGLDESAFSLARIIRAKKESAEKPKRAKYVCPSCEERLTGKPGLNIICGDCEEQMTEE